jgi:hypothetical protein
MAGEREKVQGNGNRRGLVPAGLSNRYQWKPKAPVEKPGVLRRGHWSRLRGTGWETGVFGPSQPVPKARFLVVNCRPGEDGISNTVRPLGPTIRWIDHERSRSCEVQIGYAMQLRLKQNLQS